jgi:hypothetical protein
MRKWGAIVTLAYAGILLLLVAPAYWSWNDIEFQYARWQFWAFILGLLGSEALLLCLSVDTSRKRIRPQRHVMATCLLIGALTGVLMIAAILSVEVALHRDSDLFPVWEIFTLWGALWLLWSILFYLYTRGKSDYASRLTSWVLRGSVIEMLVAVVCHIVVRRRGDCCAPAVTSWGIATGFAIMLLAFGPSVLFLFEKRLRQKTSAQKNSEMKPLPE